jgi:hypothetical protein
MEFIISIDTEGDNQWDHGRELTTENIRYVPRFQDLCEKYLIKPVYLVTSEVCEDVFAQEIFRDYMAGGKAEIGAHLHSWTTPPFHDRPGYRFNDPDHGFATEFPVDILSEKVRKLTGQIESSFGKRPLSFRSGRFGFDERLARMLAENSYLIDSSVTPWASWAGYKGLPGGNGGPDFTAKEAYPYRYSFEDKALLEIPVTILPTRFPLNTYKSFASYYFRNVDKSIPLRVFRKLMFKNQPLWLRPHGWMNLPLLDEIVREAVRLELPYLVMMFHSSELMPGCSIYRKDKEAVEKLYDLLESFFVLLQNRRIDSVTLTEAALRSKI